MKKRVSVHVDVETLKALKHCAVDEGLSASALIDRLIKKYLDDGDKCAVAPKPQVAMAIKAPAAKGLTKDKEAEHWQKEAEAFDNAMPCHPQPKKAPKIEPVEKRIEF